MCQYPAEFNGNVVACRQCDECIDAEINGWVVRAMAERSVAGQMMAITLTYADLPNGEKPVGATIFRYKDIQLFLKKLRSAYKDQYGKTGEIRYLVCGERGSNGTQRMHWHMILFTEKPIGALGKWKEFYSRDPVAIPKEETDYDWTIWGHGHVRVQWPDHRGVYYCLKYAFKDKKTAHKSKGTKRHTFAHNWAASMFRMSKQPPIGMPFLERYFQDHSLIPAVPPNLQLRVPDYEGYWHPTGKLREYAIQRCYEINAEYRDEHGRNLPQWSSLLASVKQPDELKPNKDMEGLQYGQIEEQPLTEEQQQREIQNFAAEFEKKQKLNASRALIKQCGNIIPCKECRLTWRNVQNQELVTEENHWFDKWAEKYGKDLSPESVQQFREWWQRRYRPSRGCRRRNDYDCYDAFRFAKASSKLATKITGPTEDTGRNAKSGRPRPHRNDNGGTT